MTEKNRVESTAVDETALIKLADLSLVQQVFESLEESLDRQEFLDLLVQRIVQLGNIQICSLMLVGQDGQLFIAAAAGLPEEVVRQTRIAPGDSVTGYVFASGKPLLIDDIHQDPRFAAAPGLVNYHTRSLLSTPLICRGKKLGVLNVNNKQDGQTFSETDRYLMRGVAQQAALAIENYDLINTMQVQTRDLEHAHAELQRFSQGRSRLVCNLSHELKTPLTSVLGYLDLMLSHLEEVDLDEQRAYLERALDEGVHMKDLINGMLTLFTLDSGGGRWESEPVDFLQLLRAQLADRQELLAELGLQVTESFPDCPVVVDADPDRLAFLVGSLLDNAIKFNRRDGVLALTLTIEKGPAGQQISWRVHNSGWTVPAEAAEAIFDQYTQLGDVRSGKPPGVGIGLSICKAVVDRLHGNIFLEPPRGEGTTIVVQIPLLNESGE